MGLGERRPPGTERDSQRLRERQDRGKDETAASTQEQSCFKQWCHACEWLLVTCLVPWRNGGTGVMRIVLAPLQRKASTGSAHVPIEIRPLLLHQPEGSKQHRWQRQLRGQYWSTRPWPPRLAPARHRPGSSRKRPPPSLEPSSSAWSSSALRLLKALAQYQGYPLRAVPQVAVGQVLPAFPGVLGGPVPFRNSRLLLAQAEPFEQQTHVHIAWGERLARSKSALARPISPISKYTCPRPAYASAPLGSVRAPGQSPRSPGFPHRGSSRPSPQDYALHRWGRVRWPGQSLLSPGGTC